MGKKFEARLWVNHQPIEMNAFTEEFLARVALGMVSSLKGGENVRELEIYLQEGEVGVVADGRDLPLTPFPKDVISSTLIGLISSLKGIRRVESFTVRVKLA